MGKEPSPDFKNKVSLKINDIDVELNEFVDSIFKETILGMLKALNTSDIGDEFKNIKIEVNNE